MIKTLVVLLAMVVVMGCQKSEQQLKNNVETASAVIEVKTIQCKSCVNNITKALGKVDGVQKVSVDLEKKVANVEYVSSRVTLASLETAIAKAGYDANGTSRDSAAYHALDKCCQ